MANEEQTQELQVIDRRSSATPATQAVPAEGGVLGILRAAVERGTTPELLDRLLDVQLRWEANEARKAWVSAVARFKSHAPAVLPKDGEVDFSGGKGRTHYRHATLGGILGAITPHLSREGLSVQWRVEQAEKGVTVTTLLQHEGGHFESVSLSGPLDDSGNKNRIQMVGSTVTYLQRYGLTAVLGIGTGEMDDEGCSNGNGGSHVEDLAPGAVTEKPKPPPQNRRAEKAVAAWRGLGISTEQIERFVGAPGAEWGAEAFGRLGQAWMRVMKAGPGERGKVLEDLFPRERQPGEEG